MNVLTVSCSPDLETQPFTEDEAVTLFHTHEHGLFRGGAYFHSVLVLRVLPPNGGKILKKRSKVIPRTQVYITS